MNTKQTILPEYLETLFLVKEEDVQWPQEYWIITACNPYSLRNSSGNDKRILYGNLPEAIELPDFIEFQTRSYDEFLFLFFQDNNQALARIHNAGWKISTFVGICDGCGEGGINEYIHADPFLSKVFSRRI